MNHCVRLRSLIIIVALLAPTAALGQEASDIVFLKGGGRVRGLIVEESPTAGVRVKLPDGTIKVVLAKDVDRVEYSGAKSAAEPAPKPEPEPAPSPEPAVELSPLRIESAQPGIVSIDGGEVGRAPVQLKDLAPGKHRIRISYDEGGKSEKIMFVRAGEANEVRFEKSSATKAGEAREGVKPVFTGDAVLAHGPSELTSGGLRLFGGINLGLLPAIDFRAGGAVSILGADIGIPVVMMPLHARASVRFNLGPLYSIEVGAHAGAVFALTQSDTAVWPGGGPDLSVLSFRFGSERQFEITAMETLDIVVADLASADAALMFQQSVGFSWVL
jgi:hypothetical protein